MFRWLYAVFHELSFLCVLCHDRFLIVALVHREAHGSGPVCSNNNGCTSSVEHPPGGHQQDEPVSLHLDLREVAATAHGSRFHPYSIQKRIHTCATVTPVLVRVCSLPDQVSLRTICQKVLHRSFVRLRCLRCRCTRDGHYRRPDCHWHSYTPLLPLAVRWRPWVCL